MDDLFWGTVSFLLPKDICRFCRFALEQKNTGVTLAGATWKFLASGNPFDLRAGIHPLIIGRGFLKSKHIIPSKWFSKYFWLGKYPPIHWNNRSWKCNHGSFIPYFWWRAFQLDLLRSPPSTWTWPSRNKSRLDLLMGPDLFLDVSRNPNAGYIGVEILPTYIGIIS